MGARRLNGKLNITSQNLIKIRKGHGVSQEQLAKKVQLIGMNMHPNDIYKIESGLRTVKDYEINGFAMVLNEDIKEFYEDTEKYYN